MTILKMLDPLTFLSPVLLISGVIIGAYYYKFLDSVHKILMLYLIVCLCTDLISRIYGHFYKNNLIFIILFSLSEVVIFSILYQTCFFEKKSRLSLLATSIAVSYILWEVYALRAIQVQQFQSYSKVADSFVIILLAIIFFFEKIGKNNQALMETLRLNSAILIFFSLSLIFFLPINFLINVTSDLKFYFWGANLILTLLFYTFLSWEIWKNGLTLKQLRFGS